MSDHLLHGHSRHGAVLGVKPCGCITFIDLSPSDIEAAKAQAASHGRKVEVVSYNEAVARWRREDTYDCSECGIND